MDALAIAHGSVISAAMFGALAGAGVLPFSRDSYLDVDPRRRQRREGQPRAFEAAFDRVKTGAADVAAPAQARDRPSRSPAPRRSGSRRRWSRG